MKKYFYPGATLFIISSIIYLSLTSRSVGLSINNIDKIQHALAYGVLAFFMAMSFKSWGVGPRKYIFTLLFCALMGGALEVIQSRYGRMMELNDFTADMIGALLGCIPVRFLS